MQFREIKNYNIKRQKYSREECVLPELGKVRLTPEGRALIKKDPNLSKATMNSLAQTEKNLVTKAEKNLFDNKSAAALVQTVFYGETDITLSHVALCIGEDVNQCMAELCARISNEKRISFFSAAVLIHALITERGLFYYRYSKQSGYTAENWRPQFVYIPPEPQEPPKKKLQRTRKKPRTHIPDTPVFILAPCPLCGCSTKLIRCGRGNKMWHVCCTDPNQTCENFIGREPQTSEKRAALAWNQYVSERKAGEPVI